MTDAAMSRDEVPVTLELCPELPAPRVPLDKRLFDLVGSTLLLVLLAPVFVIIAIAIALDSPGGAMYRQRRVGLDGTYFDMFKFRSMYAGNDPGAHKAYVARLILEGSSDLRNGNGTYKLDNDARITRVGEFLRRYSLDELPQLLNVFIGDMSLVGPRPPLDYEYELYTPRQCRRLQVLPGMTGLWQVSGRNSTTFDEMIDLDLDYIERRSLLLDLWIMLKTLPVIRNAEGA